LSSLLKNLKNNFSVNQLLSAIHHLGLPETNIVSSFKIKYQVTSITQNITIKVHITTIPFTHWTEKTERSSKWHPWMLSKTYKS